MRKKVKKYIYKYNIYYKAKTLKHKSYEKLQNLSILKKLWELVSMDFIVKLLKFKKLKMKIKYNLIYVMIN